MAQTTDPRGIIGKSDFDLLGRVVRSISAFAAFVPGSASDVTTEYAYDAANRDAMIPRKAPPSAHSGPQR